MRFPALAAAALCALLSACQTIVPESPIEPTLTPITKVGLSLRDLPPPAQRIKVSVYSNSDETGQYKERTNVQSLSRAVTQGGAPMLIKALQDAGERRWFTVLERAELDILLKERQIVTEMRRLYRNEQRANAHVLPPLLWAGIIIEGAIVGYDTNTVTGGLGARFLGIGADAKYQRDTVTVSLRAISTKTGEVLASVTTANSVASLALQGGTFRFVKLDELLEAEAGVTANEPRYVATRQAVEKAVLSLIIEGAELGVWHFADRAEQARLIGIYKAEKYEDEQPVNADSRPDVETARPANVTQTVARRARPRRVAARRQPAVRQVTRALPPGTQRVAPRVVTQPPAQPVIRRAVPNGSVTPERDVPPAPTVDEPAVGEAPNAAPEESAANALAWLKTSQPSRPSVVTGEP